MFTDLINDIRTDWQNYITQVQESLNKIQNKSLVGFLGSISFVVLILFRLIIIWRGNKINNSHVKIFISKTISHIGILTIFLASLYLGLDYLKLDNNLSGLGWLIQFKQLVGLVLIIRLGIIIQNFVLYGTVLYLQNKNNSTDNEFQIWRKMGILPFIIRMFVWIIALMSSLQVLGYNIQTVIASLGITTVFFAFALQNTLTDLFASISVYLDKPFQIGDDVDYNDISGTVTKIGWRSTRIKTLQGETIIVPNKKLANEIIHNYNYLRSRRIEFKIYFHIQTQISQIKEFLESVKVKFTNVDLITLNRAHLKNIDKGQLEIEIVTTVESGEYSIAMVKREVINYLILETMEELKIEHAGEVIIDDTV
jgi:small-conductance mechanosensitive channel